LLFWGGLDQGLGLAWLALRRLAKILRRLAQVLRRLAQVGVWSGPANLAHHLGGTNRFQEAAKISLVDGVGHRVHWNRGVGHHLLQHPDTGAGAHGQSDGIAGPGIQFDRL
jgi:hypothetical protein